MVSVMLLSEGSFCVASFRHGLPGCFCTCREHTNKQRPYSSVFLGRHQGTTKLHRSKFTTILQIMGIPPAVQSQKAEWPWARWKVHQKYIWQHFHFRWPDSRLALLSLGGGREQYGWGRCGDRSSMVHKTRQRKPSAFVALSLLYILLRPLYAHWSAAQQEH